MGAVLKGRDNDLGRDLAIKVLLERHGANPGLLRRFVEEAQIAGQLQHPGVVPVYELGAFADRRPYFAMKLVKGRTLAEVLAERADPSSDHPRLLAIFLDVAQTMAYAHARGVIHRDLKPSNVMVGSLRRGPGDGLGPGQGPAPGRCGRRPGRGQAGGPRDGHRHGPERLGLGLGPLAGRLGAGHALVHGAGAGPGRERPPRRAGRRLRAGLDPLRDPHRPARLHRPVVRPRSSARPPGATSSGALARLDACGADAELVALARDALAAEADDRPHHAGAVVDRLSGYLSGVQERLQAAERERAVAEARAVEERKRPQAPGSPSPPRSWPS